MMLTLLLTLCNPALAGKIRNPSVVEDALAFAEADRSKAIALLEGAWDEAKKKERGLIALNAGEQRRLAGDTELAIGWFDRAVDAQADLSPAAELAAVLLRADDGLSASDLALLASTSDKIVLATQNADRYLLLTLLAAKQDDAGKVKTYSKKSLDAGRSDPQVLERIQQRLQQLTDAPDQAVSLQSDGGDVLEKARTALTKGDNKRAATLAQRAIDAAEEGSPQAFRASYLLRRAESDTPVRADTIAVLLPQSGKYEMVGRQIEQAFNFGYNREGGKAKLVFIDTQATPEGAVAALEEAVLDKGAIAVVGPLLSTVVDGVVEAADALEVPLLSLSQSNEVTGAPWVFQGVPSVGDQVDALAEHVVVEQSRTKFGIFAPDTPAGHRAAVLFTESVTRRGGSITAEVYYDAKAKALMPFAAKLGGKDGRVGELRRLRDAAKEAGRDPSTVVLPPRSDFQAIFIPDHAHNVALAAAALAYEEFSVGQFRAKKGAHTIALIGLSGWHHDSLVTSGNEYVRNCRFTDIYDKKASSDFNRAYKGALQRSPSSLEAAVADAGRLLAQGTQAGATTRAAFAEALTKATIEDANTGSTGFGDNHRTNPKVRVLTIGYRGIQPVE